MWNDLAFSLAKFTCNKKRKLGFFFQENIYNGTRIMPLYRCFQRANLDTPHDQRKFCMQFWRMRIDSHAVSHFTELCSPPRKIGPAQQGVGHSSLKCETAWESILMRQNCMQNSRWSCGVSKFARWKHLYNGTFLIPLCTFPWEKIPIFFFILV